MANRFTVSAAVVLSLTLALPCSAQPTSRIAFVSTRDGNEEIYLMDTDGSNQTNLTNGPWSDLTPCWSPDGSRIAFASDREGSYDIYVMDADGGNVTRLTDSPYVDIDPSWSPDGWTIAFCSDRGERYSIYGVMVDGGDVYRLTDDSAHDISPSFSPDGRRIAFSSNRRLDGVVIDSGDGWEVTGSDPPGGIDVFGVRLQAADIFVMDADGTDVTNLTGGSHLLTSNWPAWSPDGSTLVFHSFDKNLGPGMFAVAAGSRELGKLYTGFDIANQFNPSWSPDGLQIAFAGNTGALFGRWSICVMGAEGGGAVRLTEPAPESTWGDADPAWSPVIEADGTQVAPASWGQVKRSVR